MADGKDYRAKVRISDSENETLAEAGETCERVPADALGWLLTSGLIEAVTVVVPTIAPVESAIASAPVETRDDEDMA